METIIVGFSRPKYFKPFAWLIMKAYSIPYSHVYLKFYSEKYDRWLIYQASGTMVNFMNIETFEEEAEVIYETQIKISNEERSKIMQFAIDHCGRPYGIKECFGFAAVKIAEWFGKKIKNPLADGSRTLVCSEVAAIVLEILTISLPKDPDDMTPLDIFNLLVPINKNNQ